MTDDKYSLYFPTMKNDRINLFKNFYNISFINDLPVTNKNRINKGFHPLIASYVLRHILWEIINCPPGSVFKNPEEYSINNQMYEISKNVFWSIYKEAINEKDLFIYSNEFNTGSIYSTYSGLTNAKMLYIYSYYNLIAKSKIYEKFCHRLLDSLLLDIQHQGCCIKLTEDKYWIDEENNYPSFILNGFLSVIRNLIDLTKVIKNDKIDYILSNNKNILEHLLPKFDCEKYKTSKYRLTSYGQLKIKINNRILNKENIKLKIIYNDVYKYSFNYSNIDYNSATFQNIFKIINKEIIIQFIYSEIFTNKIEIFFKNENFDIIDLEVCEYKYTSINAYKQPIHFIKCPLQYTKKNNNILININKDLTDYFIPSITYFTKKYNNSLYNVYHYNHIDNLLYINKYFKSDLIEIYINKWNEYIKHWSKLKIYNLLTNISYLRINQT